MAEKVRNIRVGTKNPHHYEFSKFLEKVYGGWFVSIKYHGNGVFSGLGRDKASVESRFLIKRGRMYLTYREYLERTGQTLEKDWIEKGFGKEGCCGICLGSESLHQVKGFLD